VLTPEGKAVRETVMYCEAAKKLFDEVLNNSTDNTTRARPGAPTTGIVVQVEPNKVVISNNGRTIPIEPKPEWDGQFIAEGLITRFGSSENFDDTVDRQTAGLNGLGVKVVAALSREFVLRCCDGACEYVQHFKNNLATVDPPDISPSTAKSGTSVEFEPDWDRFQGVTSYEPMMGVLKLAVYRTAAFFSDVRVFWGREKITTTTLQSYGALFGYEPNTLRYHTVTVDMQVMRFAYGKSHGETFQHDSMVNGINTPLGGTHVDCIVQAIVQALEKKTQATAAQIKSSLFIICFFTASFPTFNAQIKTALRSKIDKALVAAIGAEVASAFQKKTDETGLLEHVTAKNALLSKLSINKSLSGKASRRVPELLDARLAGKKGCNNAMLFITEGASAMPMCADGFAVVGTELYGAMPIRGKINNVHGTGLASAVETIPVIGAIATALGLRVGTKPGDASLRYGRVVLMTDQDLHGAHITGLLLCMFNELWPELLTSGFVWKFITPVIKATWHGKVHDFFDEPSFNQWAVDKTGFTTRFYKGLGSSVPEETREYFSNLPGHLKQMTCDDAGKAALQLAFDKKRADDRKEWMTQAVSALDYADPTIDVNCFVNNEIKNFALFQVQHLIPNFFDGLNNVQRKILFVLKKTPKKEMKIASLSGFLVAEAAYHHGDTSSQAAIISMAASYPTSNNLPLLLGFGATGSRLGASTTTVVKSYRDFKVGHDASSARYVSVALAPTVDRLFLSTENAMLRYTPIDGAPVEPDHYFPVLPLAVVNGTHAIATGHATTMPGHDPLEVLEALVMRITRKTWPDINPKYRGFTGTFERVDNKKWICRGVFTVQGDIVRVTELPIGMSILGYKAWLEDVPECSHIVNASHSNKIDFTFKWQGEGELTHKRLNLQEMTPLQIKFVIGDQVVEYGSVLEYMEAWFTKRYEWVTARRNRVTAAIEKDIRDEEQKIEWLSTILSWNTPQITRTDIMAKLNNPEASNFVSHLRYWNCTTEGVEEHRQELARIKKKLEAYLVLDVDAIMLSELDDLRGALKQQLDDNDKRNFFHTGEPTAKRGKHNL
jgi:DNA topoisomerase-2